LHKIIPILTIHIYIYLVSILRSLNGDIMEKNIYLKNLIVPGAKEMPHSLSGRMSTNKGLTAQLSQRAVLE